MTSIIIGHLKSVIEVPIHFKRIIMTVAVMYLLFCENIIIQDSLSAVISLADLQAKLAPSVASAEKAIIQY